MNADKYSFGDLTTDLNAHSLFEWVKPQFIESISLLFAFISINGVRHDLMPIWQQFIVLSIEFFLLKFMFGYIF